MAFTAHRARPAAWRSMQAFLGAGVALMLGGPVRPAAAGEAALPATAASAPQAAGCDAACVRTNTDRAVAACAPVIEAQSPTDFDWLNRPVPGIFQQAEQPAGRDPVVRYRGDSIRFQTAAKDWARMSYECGYDVVAHRVVTVALHPGRLPAAIGRVAASVRLPDERVAAPSRVPMQMAAPEAMPPQPPATPVPAQTAPKKPPRVGEPSPIEIEQQAPRVRP